MVGIAYCQIVAEQVANRGGAEPGTFRFRNAVIAEIGGMAPASAGRRRRQSAAVCRASEQRKGGVSGAAEAGSRAIVKPATLSRRGDPP